MTSLDGAAWVRTWREAGARLEAIRRDVTQKFRVDLPEAHRLWHGGRLVMFSGAIAAAAVKGGARRQHLVTR